MVAMSRTWLVVDFVHMPICCTGSLSHTVIKTAALAVAIHNHQSIKTHEPLPSHQP